MVENILEFRGPTRWLSNFHIAPIHADGVIYPTNEHYYQSFKSPDPKEREAILACKTPYEAMIAGRNTKRSFPKKGWDKMKLDIMFTATLLKYTQHSDLQEKLLDTDHCLLVEGNTWGDTIWGECPVGTGQNLLGKIIMRVRTLLRERYL